MSDLEDPDFSSHDELDVVDVDMEIEIEPPGPVPAPSAPASGDRSPARPSTSAVARTGRHREQLALFTAVPEELEFVRGVVVDHSGLARFTHVIRAADDPERSPRPVGGRADRAPHRTLALRPVAECAALILDLMQDGRARTFNAIAVTLLDHTADTVLDSPFEEALWQLVEAEQLEHTMVAPIRFRIVAGDANTDETR